MKRIDVVYFVKDTPDNDELIYSVRSVVENFPYRKIWFVGGCPKGIRPDGHIRFIQNRGSKYANVRGMIELVSNCQDITEDFWLFNDDFFVMSKVAEPKTIVRESLWRTYQRLQDKYKSPTGYAKKLKRTAVILKDINKDRLNYDAHVPMMINRDKAKTVLKIFDGTVAFRSVYGNYYQIGGVVHPDVKIIDTDERPDPDIHNVYLSTSDQSFYFGKAGEVIRKTFTEPSKYEVAE